MLRLLALLALPFTFGLTPGCGGDAGDIGPDADPSAPVCTITAPVDGTTVDFDESLTLEASASDPEDGPLAGASIVWTTDLASTPLGTGLSVALDQLPAPGVHTITCSASDSDGNSGAATIQITSRSPVADLNHPGDGEIRAAAEPIPFTGDGRDFEDGSLPDSALEWTASLDGSIGTGSSFERTLSPGTNVITLTVTDSDSNTTSTSITLTITP